MFSMSGIHTHSCASLVAGTELLSTKCIGEQTMSMDIDALVEA